MRKTTEAVTPGESMRTAGPPLAAVMALAILAGTLFPGAGAEALAQEGAAGKEAGRAEVTGFRSARFGMSMPETLKAIQSDFRLRQAEVATQPNDEDGTLSLVAAVKDLPPGGPAQIVYIHGFKKRALLQINVVWGMPAVGKPDPQTLVTAANILRKYFQRSGFDPEKTAINARVDDGTFIAFRSTDDRGRMVLLRLLSRKIAAAKGEKKAKPQDRVVSLWLSYIENTRNPDVFRLKKGKF